MIELAGIVILGIMAQWLAWRTRVPAILPLILIGLLIGPGAEYFLGEKLINPVYDSETHKGLFTEKKSLFYFVSLAIGIILFEGGLTLNRREIKDVAPAILKLITIGSIITFIGGGIAAWYVLDLSMPIAFLFGGLIIVTGPTVIAPILRNVPLNKNVSTVLKWEGILIDPIGALVAVLVYQFIVAGEAEQAFFTKTVLVTFGRILVTGTAIGLGAAIFLHQLIKREWVPQYLINVFTLALVLAAFVLSDILEHESGLLTVVVMGMTLGNIKLKQFEHILDFKESLTVLLISILFILLSANISVEQLSLLGWSSIVVFAIVVFILRPLGVFISTIGVNLNMREKLFISWIGPRGIVAAGIASLFGIKLMQAEGLPPDIQEQAALITPLVFLIVLGTVLLNATTARLVARLLGVTLPTSEGVLIVGANRGARLIAKYLDSIGKQNVLIDSSPRMVATAKQEGLEAIKDNIFADDLTDRYELLAMGHVMALTSSPEVNIFATKKLKKSFGELGAYRLITNQELDFAKDHIPQDVLFNNKIDYARLDSISKKYPDVHELSIDSKEDLIKGLDDMGELRVPLFLKSGEENDLTFITVNIIEDINIKEDSKLIYLGKVIEQEETLEEYEREDTTTTE